MLYSFDGLATAASTSKASWSWANPVFYNPYTSRGGYYNVFKVVAPTSGDFTFSSESFVSTMGFLYLPTFTDTSPEEHLVTYGYPSGTNQQFGFTYYLESGTSYYLLVTTYRFLEIGQYKVSVTGAVKANVRRMTGNDQIRENSE